MKANPFFFHKLFCSPLMLMEPVRHSLEAGLMRHMGMGGASGPKEEPITGSQRGNPMEEWLQYSRDVKATKEILRLENVLQTYGNVAVVSLSGVIDKHLTDFEMDCYGGYDLADFDNALSLVAMEPRIERVVLAINSPGGSVTGVPESAARVAALTKEKEVHAFVDGMACSASYYIASQADHIAAAPSATLGSIGVYMALLDETRALEMDGYKVELIKAGKFKAMGASFKALAPEERAMLQASVDSLHAEFKAAVKSGRRGPTERGGHQTVADSVMEGQWFDGTAALQARLCDELTGLNLAEYVDGLI